MPFLAALGYKTAIDGKFNYNCGGALINRLNLKKSKKNCEMTEWFSRRYVVTAAHCHHESITRLQIAQVVLGEHDTSKDPDCDETQVETCRSVQKFDITPADVTLHPGWVPSRVSLEKNRSSLSFEFWISFRLSPTATISRWSDSQSRPWRSTRTNISRFCQFAWLGTAEFSYRIKNSLSLDGVELTMILRIMAKSRTRARLLPFFWNWSFPSSRSTSASPITASSRKSVPRNTCVLEEKEVRHLRIWREVRNLPLNFRQGFMLWRLWRSAHCKERKQGTDVPHGNRIVWNEKVRPGIPRRLHEHGLLHELAQRKHASLRSWAQTAQFNL